MGQVSPPRHLPSLLLNLDQKLTETHIGPPVPYLLALDLNDTKLGELET